MPTEVAKNRARGWLAHFCLSLLRAQSSSPFRATKGIGRTAPTKWKDAGKALNNEELEGCIMPDGPCADDPSPKGYLQYNEVSGVAEDNKSSQMLISFLRSILSTISPKFGSSISLWFRCRTFASRSSVFYEVFCFCLDELSQLPMDYYL